MRSAIMKFFAFDHLPPHLQEIAKPFSTAAEFVDPEVWPELTPGACFFVTFERQPE